MLSGSGARGVGVAGGVTRLVRFSVRSVRLRRRFRGMAAALLAALHLRLRRCQGGVWAHQRRFRWRLRLWQGVSPSPLRLRLRRRQGVPPSLLRPRLRLKHGVSLSFQQSRRLRLQLQ